MSTRKSTASTETRAAKGRFAPGNPGRRKGSRNRATIVAQSLLDKDVRAITGKAIDMAKAGDVQALRLCLERLIAPTREAPLRIDLPVPASASEVPATLTAILHAAALGNITSGEAERIGRVVETLARTYELATFDERLKALEQAHAK